MTSPISSPLCDTNEVAPSWEDVCLSPYEYSQEEGRAQGRQEGSLAGFDQGYSLGQTTALSYGMEIGFMRGVVVVLEERMKQQQNHKMGDRIDKSLQNLQAALDDFPSPEALHSNETDVARKFERAQTCFKLLITQLGVPNLSLHRIMEDPTSLLSGRRRSHSTNASLSNHHDTQSDW